MISALMHLQFVEAETTFNYFAGVRSYLSEFGKPLERRGELCILRK
jgi:hypothetical protein